HLARVGVPTVEPLLGHTTTLTDPCWRRSRCQGTPLQAHQEGRTGADNLTMDGTILPGTPLTLTHGQGSSLSRGRIARHWGVLKALRTIAQGTAALRRQWAPDASGRRSSLGLPVLRAGPDR